MTASCKAFLTTGAFSPIRVAQRDVRLLSKTLGNVVAFYPELVLGFGAHLVSAKMPRSVVDNDERVLLRRNRSVAVEAEPVLYHFDEFCLDTLQGILIHDANKFLNLRPKSFALLRLFVQNPDKLYSRSELLHALWPAVVVTDDSLTQCVSDLRRAFGKRAPHLLRTVSRRGYVFTAEVRSEVVAKLRPTPSVPIEIDRAVTTASLFLEPFGSLGTGIDIELAKTLTADLMSELTRFEGVRYSTASGQLSGFYRVKGEIRIFKAKLRIDLRLEDALRGIVVWAAVFERPRVGDAEIPEGLVDLIAATVVRQVDREDLRKARLKKETHLTVRDLYLIGRDHHQRGTGNDTIVALSMFERAIELAPEFALLFAWQAYTIHRVITHGWGPPIDMKTARERALSYARRAVQLEPESALCLSRLAFVLILHQRWDEAIEMARAALQIARHSDYASRNTCCEVLAHAGQPQEAADAVRPALSLDPHCPPTTRSLLGRALLLSNDPEAALPELRWCAARLPDYAPCFHSIIVAAFETGRMDEARDACREAVRLQPSWVPINHTGTWFFRFEQDAERFRLAFRAVGWGDAVSSFNENAIASFKTMPSSQI